MSRDQKPGKVKLVGVAAPNPGRRRDDQLPGQAATGSGDAPAHASEVRVNGGSGMLLALLFLLCCAIGGAAAVFFGLVGGLPG